MDSFELWLQTTTHSGVQKYAKLLIELGASWESFRRERNEIINDLINADIPRIVASDIVAAATEALQSKSRPMAIFWDMENLPIPTYSSGTEVASRIKSILSPHGDLVQFRGYASIGLNHIPEQKRSELQLSGCHLVDCPHVGRKEVADKMIIVDAMEFAFNNILVGATLVFITCDVDYAYLLAKLRKPQWKTIVISKTNHNSMLQINCDINLKWEKDVLLSHVPRTLSLPPPGFEMDSDETPTKTSLSDEIIERRATYLSKVMSTDSCNVGKHSNDSCTNGNAASDANITTMNEHDVNLLRSMVMRYSHVGKGSGSGTLKCHIGSELRQQYPTRFPDTKSMQRFLEDAIKAAVVVQGVEEGSAVYYLPENVPELDSPKICICNVPPIPVSDIPAKTRTKCTTLPFVLFVKKMNIPSGCKVPEKVMVQSTGLWLMLMFRSLSDVQVAIKASPWLSVGRLVNWGEILQENDSKMQLEPKQFYVCTSCNMYCPDYESFTIKTLKEDNELLCRTCFESNPELWNDREHDLAATKVASMLQMMADNDDFLFPSNLFRKSLIERWPQDCKSRGQATLWIETAVSKGIVKEFKWKYGKNSKSKMKVVCLCKYEYITELLCNDKDSDYDTSKEEQFVVDFLWERGENGMITTRKNLIEILQNKFPGSMNTPINRVKMILNAGEKRRFFVAKGPLGQVVGLTLEDAQISLDQMHSLFHIVNVKLGS